MWFSRTPKDKRSILAHSSEFLSKRGLKDCALSKGCSPMHGNDLRSIGKFWLFRQDCICQKKTQLESELQ
ncbi:hypothetical protein D3C71_1017950 [compost metagenome]